MGHRVGYIAGLVGGKQVEVRPSGMIFPEDPKNIARWKRWFKYLLIDQWAVFFVGALFGMMLPTMIVYQLRQTSGAPVTDLNIPTYAADQLGLQFGPFLRTWALVVGFFILFSTQLGVFDLLSRQFVDGAHAISARFRRFTQGNPRRFYYPFLLLLAGAITGFLFLLPPFRLIQVSANFSNLPAMIMPFAVIYLNRRLPKVARLRWWSYIVLLLNVVFFGFFFINFAVNELTGKPLVTF